MHRGNRALLALAAAFGVAACSPAAPQYRVSGPLGFDPAVRRAIHRPATTTTPIQHVIIVIQENRSFDNLFGRFPGADGATSGRTHTGTLHKLVKSNLLFATGDLTHSYKAFTEEYDHGKMDGFDTITLYNGKAYVPAGFSAYQYVDPAQIAPYWSLAKQYVLADRLFQTQGSGSYTAHQDLIAGGTKIGPGRAIVDVPSRFPWGCDSAPGTATSLISFNNHVGIDAGPFPCFAYGTMRDLLDAAGVSWKYYVLPFKCPPKCKNSGALWNAFDSISAVRYGPEWSSNISTPQTNIFSDISSGQLAAVSWLVPTVANSDHPRWPSDTGPSWVAQVVNAVGTSSAWNTTAIVILWDDWGGFYDHVRPARLGYGSLGFRVPMIVVSPYAQTGLVAHTHYEFGSILRFIEDNWNLGRLGTSDVRATSIANVFDFLQTPRTFTPIAAKYSKEYFLHQHPSYEPVDDE